MKRKMFLNLLALSLLVTGCAGENQNPKSDNPSQKEEDKEKPQEDTRTLKEKVYDTITSLKTAKSYKSIYFKEGLTNKNIVYTENYIYSSATKGGVMLLNGFTSSVNTAVFGFSESSGVVTVNMAEVDDNGNYITSLDSFNTFRKISVTKDDLIESEDKETVTITSASLIASLKELIGEDEDNPFEVASVVLKFDRFSDLSLSFKAEDGALVDEATITDIEKASNSNVDYFMEKNAKDYFSSDSLTEDNLSIVRSQNLAIKAEIKHVVDSNLSIYRTIDTEKSASKIYRVTKDAFSETIDEESYINEDNKVYRETLSAKNTVIKEESDVDFSSLYNDSAFVPELFKKGTGNNYNYYGDSNKADAILFGILGTTDYGSVTSLYAVSVNGKVTSLYFETEDEEDEKVYAISASFSALDSEARSMSPKPSVEGTTDRIQTAFDKLKYSASTNGFKTSINDRSAHSEYNSIESVYTKDTVMTYTRKIQLNDNYNLQGTGYRAYSDGLMKMTVGGTSEDGTPNTYDYFFSSNSSLDADGKLEDYWFDFASSANIFYAIPGETNRFRAYKNLAGFEESLPISLYQDSETGENVEEVEDVVLVLDSNDSLTSIEFTIHDLVDDDSSKSTMTFTYGTEASPILDTATSAKIDKVYDKLTQPTSFMEVKTVYEALHTTDSDYLNGTEIIWSDEQIKAIPYLHADGAVWMASASEFSFDTWGNVFDKASIYFSTTGVFADDTACNQYATDYTNLLKKSSGFTLSTITYDDGLTYYENATLKMSIAIEYYYGTMTIYVRKLS